ncbi:sensor domain-containing protein [Bacillus taeanensis]|uniref:GGDEF domain-containing protein n=1 Tax=Bacillus taeanensis TaxID=273032 RepID=A0A366XQG2_9BACI|nr:EAL domain-containing protein [Bacillus taeanensis]RBW68352.1 GGDEF domain-containing protein [Bacillus taeanensis]
MTNKQIEKKLNKTLKKLEDIEFALNESSIVAITEKKGIINYVNKKFCDISKYKEEELIGQDHKIVNAGYHSKAFFKQMWQTIGSGNVWKGEIKNKAKDGSFYWVDTTIVPFLDGHGKPYQYVSIRNDITKKKAMEEEIKQMAYYDSLTELPNRNFLNKHLQTVIGNKKPAAIMFLDLDRFKVINDTMGHIAGDLLLKQTAVRLKEILPSSAFISRTGGDEFVVILEDIRSENDAAKIAEHIITSLEAPFLINEETFFISTSIGISLYEPHHLTTESLPVEKVIESEIRKADIAMYYAKELGGGTYQLNTPLLNEKVSRKMTLETQLNRALQNDEFTLHYQPQFDLHTDSITGVEALLRWHHPQFGLISPNEFIPILEETGLIVSVGRWVIETACTQMKQWQKEGVPIQHAAVNVSAKQFKNVHFAKEVIQILRKVELNPACLELEITESMIQNVKETKIILQALKDFGVRTSIDDFGTGYSSLSYLQHLPIDCLKIDKSFIYEMSKGEEIMVKTIINMGKSLQFNIVAEGIENEEQLSLLQQYGCHYGQGYFYSKPLAPEQLKTFLEENRIPALQTLND